MSRPLSFQQIVVFKTVIETGTTTRAAIELNTTQPSISRKLAELQHAAGLQLFELHHGRLRPTREGRRLYQSVQKHFEGLEKIETDLDMLRQSRAGVLRIGATLTLETGFLPKVIDRFLQQFPETVINLQTAATTRQLEDYLHRELIDLALATGAMDTALFRCSTIARTQAVCIVPHEHELARLPSVDLYTLHRYRLILPSDTDSMVIRMRKLLVKGDYVEDVVVETDSPIAICALVAAGVGIGIASPFIVNAFSGQFAIKELTPTIPVEVILAQSIAAPPSMVAKAFLEMLAP